jgi:hypothetical protein
LKKQYRSPYSFPDENLLLHICLRFLRLESFIGTFLLAQYEENRDVGMDFTDGGVPSLASIFDCIRLAIDYTRPEKIG